MCPLSASAEKYGDTAYECGEAFFLCGKSLLELARFVNFLPWNVLEGVTNLTVAALSFCFFKSISSDVLKFKMYCKVVAVMDWITWQLVDVVVRMENSVLGNALEGVPEESEEEEPPSNSNIESANNLDGQYLQ